MAKYIVHLWTTAQTSVEVEADDRDAAIDLAIGADMPRICAQCSGWGQSQNLEISDMWDTSGVTEPDGSYWDARNEADSDAS